MDAVITYTTKNIYKILGRGLNPAFPPLFAHLCFQRSPGRGQGAGNVPFQHQHKGLRTLNAAAQRLNQTPKARTQSS